MNYRFKPQPQHVNAILSCLQGGDRKTASEVYNVLSLKAPIDWPKLSRTLFWLEQEKLVKKIGDRSRAVYLWWLSDKGKQQLSKEGA